jgi:hypothetical protein
MSASTERFGAADRTPVDYGQFGVRIGFGIDYEPMDRLRISDIPDLSLVCLHG